MQQCKTGLHVRQSREQLCSLTHKDTTSSLYCMYVQAKTTYICANSDETHACTTADSPTQRYKYE